MSEASVFRRVRTVTDADTDAFGHVNNLVWIRFIVELAQDHLREVGLDYAATARIGGVWIVHRHEVDYHAPGMPGERILEETWVSEFRGARSIRCSRFSKESNSSALVSGLTHWAYVDARTHRPRRIDPEILSRFSTGPG